MLRIWKNWNIEIMDINRRDEIHDEIVELIYMQSKTTRTVVLFLMEKYKIEKSAAYKYVSESKQQAADKYNEMNVNSLEDSLNQLEGLLEESREVGDRKLVLEIQKEINKLNQLHIQKLDITSDNEKIKININLK